MSYQRIISVLKEKKEPLTQREISKSMPSMNRAVLLGYLRCLVDLGKIKSKNSGKAKIYYI
ncbi:MAG: hypothetical protein ABIF88_01960 [archaeon]